jgi:hypothetical protein
MKRVLSYTAGIIVLAIGLVTGSAVAQTTANGPYYATPSWDQTLPASTRFIVLSNMSGAAVLDRETGLVWQRSPDTTARDWANASDFCTFIPVGGGRKGLRLPTVQELASLLDLTQSPALPSGHPFSNVQFTRNGQVVFYWSASTSALDSTQANVVLFQTGEVGFNPKSSAIGFTWCVRGGQGVGNVP